MSARLVLRIARRDALRAKGRSVLIAAMVALPVLGMTTADVFARSGQLDRGEELAREMGRAEAVLLPAYGVGVPILQTPDGNGYATPTDEPPVGDGEGDLSVGAPAGSRLLPVVEVAATARTTAGQADITVTEVDWADPVAAPLVLGRKGRAATSDTEAVVSPALLERTGLEVGDTIELVEPVRSLTVVGVAAPYDRARDLSMTVRPGVVSEGEVPPYRVLVDSAEPVTWEQVMAANEHGVKVRSRAVLADPPPDSEVPYFERAGYYDFGNGTGVEEVLMGVILVGAVALEVALLAGAAFAVGTRRQARWLAQVAATGGEPRHVRRIVLAGGLVLGAAGAVTGLVGGIALAAVLLAVVRAYGFFEPGHVDLRVLELAAIVLVGIATGVIAAVLPARTAARQDVVRVLAGRRGSVRVGKRLPVIGVAMTVLGAAAAAVGSAWALAILTEDSTAPGNAINGAAGLIAGGAAVAEIGLILSAGAVLALAGRLARWLPLSARLAVRDAARQRGRTAPAVAAVLAAVTGACAALLVVSATDDKDRRQYSAQGPLGSASISLTTYTDIGLGSQPEEQRVDPARVEQALRRELPLATSATFDSVVDPACADPSGNSGEVCRSLAVHAQPEHRCPGIYAVDVDEARWQELQKDPRCQEGDFAWMTTVVQPDELESVLGRADPEAKAVLASGGVVMVGETSLIHDGKTSVVRERYEEGVSPLVDEEAVPAVAVQGPQGFRATLLSPSLVERLGFTHSPSALLVQTSRMPTAAEEDAARSALSGISDQLSLRVERGYTSDYGPGILALIVGAGVIVLGASAIATGLSQAESRPDQATLAAVGAAPSVRRRLAAAQALTVAGIGTTLGVLAGLVPALAYIGADPSLQAVAPVGPLLGLLIGVPLLAAGFAWLFTRSRLPAVGRMA